MEGAYSAVTTTGPDARRSGRPVGLRVSASWRRDFLLALDLLVDLAGVLAADLLAEVFFAGVLDAVFFEVALAAVFGSSSSWLVPWTRRTW